MIRTSLKRAAARTIVILAVTLATVLSAMEMIGNQQFGWWRGEPVLQNQPPATGFVAARWHFGTNGNIRHMGWAHNYPYSDQNLNNFLTRATGIDVQRASYRIVELGSDEVFDYPFAYVSEPGEMQLTDQEVVNLREFVLRGGFILVDDFDGSWQFEQLRAQIRRAFPRKDLVPLSVDEQIFHINFDLTNFDRMAANVPGGEITYYGLHDDKDRLVLVAGHNNDLANFWEWYDQPSMPLEPAADAFRLGTNVVLYSLTH
ncbi:MAG: DUF4159 domain-containing protein [Steroidobacteraceae bacterium]